MIKQEGALGYEAVSLEYQAKMRELVWTDAATLAEEIRWTRLRPCPIALHLEDEQSPQAYHKMLITRKDC